MSDGDDGSSATSGMEGSLKIGLALERVGVMGIFDGDGDEVLEMDRVGVI